MAVTTQVTPRRQLSLFLLFMYSFNAPKRHNMGSIPVFKYIGTNPTLLLGFAALHGRPSPGSGSSWLRDEDALMPLCFPGARNLLHHLLEMGQGVGTSDGCDFSSRARSITVIIPQLQGC